MQVVRQTWLEMPEESQHHLLDAERHAISCDIETEYERTACLT